MLVSESPQDIGIQLTLLQRHSGLLALRRASRHRPQSLTLSSSRAYNTTLPQRAESTDYFPFQLQDLSTAAILSSFKPHTPQTLTEKIVQRHSVSLGKDQYVKAGDFVDLRPHCCMTHGKRMGRKSWARTGNLTGVDNSWPTALKFMSMGAKKIKDPSQIVMALDHDVQNKSDSNLKKICADRSVCESTRSRLLVGTRSHYSSFLIDIHLCIATSSTLPSSCHAFWT